MNTNILFRSSTAIVDFLNKHPAYWSDPTLTGIGGIGDQAGVHKLTTVSNLWMKCWNFEQIPTTYEFVDFCIEHWEKESQGAWPEKLEHIGGISAKIHRNFYPSFIDSMYVFALFVESGKFRTVEYDHVIDSIGKIDLVVERFDGKKNGVALRVGTKKSKTAAEYKNVFRQGPNSLYPVRIFELDVKTRPKTFGNKRWYKIDDFQLLFDWASGQRKGQQVFDWAEGCNV